MRLLCAAALFLSVGLVPADDTKPTDRAGQLAALKKKYEAENAELVAQFEKASNPGDRRAIQGEMRELALLTAGKAFELAKADPKDAAGFDALAFVVRTAGKFGAAGGDVPKAVALLTENHASNPKVKELLVPAMGLGDAGEAFVKAVAEKTTDKETKGVALFIRGYKLALQVEEEEDDKKLAALVKEATELLETAAKTAAGAKLGDGDKAPTVGEIAAKQIDVLKAVLALGVGKPAPEVVTTTLDGKKATLSEHKGKVVLLDIWATWCGPCVRMIPHERELVKSMKDKPFDLISVSVDDKKETLEKFLEKEAMPWTHWWQGGQDTPVMAKYRVRAFPTLYLIDHTGVIRHKWVGSPEPEVLDKAVDELVKAAIKAKG